MNVTQLKELKSKLDFGSVIQRVQRYTYSELGLGRLDEIEFMTDLNSIEHELNKVNEIKNIVNEYGDLPLEELTDVRDILSKSRIEGHYISPDDFIRVKNFMIASRKLRKHIGESSNENGADFRWAKSYCAGIYTDRILEHNIEITIDDSGAVKDTASANLNKIRKQIAQQSGRLRKSLDTILKRVSEMEYTQEDIVTQRDGRFVIPVKTENKNNVDGIIHGASSSGQTVFIEPAEIISMNNELTELHFEEKREIDRILRELASQIRKVHDELSGNCMILGEIDFVQAKAKYAIETISSLPILSEDEIHLKNAYHPVLLQTHQRSGVVPLEFMLGNDFNSLVISGPNAGGKTVVLKTVGLCSLMLQSGFLIPADSDSKIRIFNSIFVSIGDEQSIENDLSTFSSHLLSIKDIVELADSDSLVLIDEIASGTDPVLGSALSSAILKSLSERNALTVVTTHNSELKEFAYSTDKIENASLEFDSESLSPTFRFVTGLPGQSFTFEIAKKFNFSESIISRSKAYLSETENRLEELLGELNETKQKFDALKRKTDIENARLTGLTNLYEEKLKQIKDNEKVLRQKARLEAEEIVKDARKLVEKTVKEIREEKLSPKQAKEIIEAAERDLSKTIEAEKSDTSGKDAVQVGDIGGISGSNTEGEVIDITDEVVSLNINGFVVKLPRQEVEKRKSGTISKSASDTLIEINDAPVSFSLDIRGKYSYEIKDLVDKFIYESVKNGLHQVSIIHGKGSGKLREEVRRQLKNAPHVKSFRAGNWNEGDTGVTIIEL